MNTKTKKKNGQFDDFFRVARKLEVYEKKRKGNERTGIEVIMVDLIDLIE